MMAHVLMVERRMHSVCGSDRRCVQLFFHKLDFLFVTPKSELSRFLDWGACLSARSPLAPVSPPRRFPELRPSPWSSVSFPSSNLGFFSVWLSDPDFLERITRLASLFPCLSQCDLESFYWLHSSHLSALSGHFHHLPGLADLLISIRGLLNLIVLIFSTTSTEQMKQITIHSLDTDMSWVMVCHVWTMEHILS